MEAILCRHWAEGSVGIEALAHAVVARADTMPGHLRLSYPDAMPLADKLRTVARSIYGAGDILEIAPPQGATMLLPFTNAVVPTVDISGGRVLIELPQEIEGDSPEATE